MKEIKVKDKVVIKETNEIKEVDYIDSSLPLRCEYYLEDDDKTYKREELIPLEEYLNRQKGTFEEVEFKDKVIVKETMEEKVVEYIYYDSDNTLYLLRSENERQKDIIEYDKNHWYKRDEFVTKEEYKKPTTKIKLQLERLKRKIKNGTISSLDDLSDYIKEVVSDIKDDSFIIICFLSIVVGANISLLVASNYKDSKEPIESNIDESEKSLLEQRIEELMKNSYENIEYDETNKVLKLK